MLLVADKYNFDLAVHNSVAAVVFPVPLLWLGSAALPALHLLHSVAVFPVLLLQRSVAFSALLLLDSAVLPVPLLWLGSAVPPALLPQRSAVLPVVLHISYKTYPGQIADFHN